MSLQTHNEQQQRRRSNGGAKAQKKDLCTYRGVRMRNCGRWMSEIRMPQKRGRIWLRSYELACKAALAYDFTAFCLRGRRAKLNFPEPRPYLPSEFFIPTSPQSIQETANQFVEENSSRDGVRSEPVAAVERQKMLIAATLSEGCSSISSSNDDNNSNSMGFEAIGNGSREQLPAVDLDFCVFDCLSQFLATRSHTD